MDNENNNGSVLGKITSTFHVSLETFITIVSIIVVIGFSCAFLKEMFFANDVKDIYMNWEDIIYVSDYFDDKEGTEIVNVTIESTRGLPYGVNVKRYELSKSKSCPIIISDSVTVPTMSGNTLILPPHFDSVYGYVREYNKLLQEEE